LKKDQIITTTVAPHFLRVIKKKPNNLSKGKQNSSMSILSPIIKACGLDRYQFLKFYWKTASLNWSCIYVKG